MFEDIGLREGELVLLSRGGIPREEFRDIEGLCKGDLGVWLTLEDDTERNGCGERFSR